MNLGWAGHRSSGPAMARLGAAWRRKARLGMSGGSLERVSFPLIIGLSANKIFVARRVVVGPGRSRLGKAGSWHGVEGGVLL